jgi:septal ring factor EnvC (AmiA/AmiB activator)
METRTIILMAVLALAAVGAVAFGGLQYQEHAQTRSALRAANADLQKTRSDLKSAQDELISLRKRYSEQELALQQLQAEMATARAFVEAEKAVGARLRDELAKQKEESAAALDKARTPQNRLAPPSVLDAPPVQGRRRGAQPSAPP